LAAIIKKPDMKRLSIISLAIFSAIYAKPQVTEQDSLALVSLYNATNGVNWFFNNHWLEAGWPVELWIGIEIEDSRVVQINLPNNNLEGNIPTEIGNLDSLSILDVSGNSINGIPPSIGNLKTLDTLALFGCPVNTLPPEIGSLTDLKYFNICYTQITELPDELGGLSRLEYFMGWNGMLQGLPESIGNMTSLKEINLAVNDISNLPSSIGNCTNLIRLQLNANEIPTVPVEIGNLVNLEYLILGGNNLSALPNEIFNLTSLKYLNFAANGLDTIPSLIGNLANLENFQFFSNNFTYIPEEIGNCINLDYINGYGNNIASLPLTLLNLPNIETLFLAYNSLTFEDIEPLVSIPGFEYWGQDSIGTAIDTTVLVDSAFYMEIQTGGEFNMYQWKKDGEIIEGATDYYLDFSNVAYADSGSYNCEITNYLATGLTLLSRMIKLHIIDFASINESYNYQLSIYPNPTHNKLFIDIFENVNPDGYEISILNTVGMVVKKCSFKNVPAEIDIAELKNGVYFLKIMDSKNELRGNLKKIVKI
jgi:Leucine-rich repeat (LRR) protein